MTIFDDFAEMHRQVLTSPRFGVQAYGPIVVSQGYIDHALDRFLRSLNARDRCRIDAILEVGNLAEHFYMLTR